MRLEKIPKEIMDYEPRIFLGITKRKAIALGLSSVLILFIILLLKPFLSTDTVAFVAIFAASPILTAGFVKINGMPLEKFIKILLQSKLSENKLIYKTQHNKSMQKLFDDNRKNKIPFDPSCMFRYDPLTGKKVESECEEHIKEFQTSGPFKGFIDSSIETPEYKQKIAEKYKKNKPKEDLNFKEFSSKR